MARHLLVSVHVLVTPNRRRAMLATRPVRCLAIERSRPTLTCIHVRRPEALVSGVGATAAPETDHNHVDLS